MAFETLLIEQGAAPDIVDDTGIGGITYVGFAAPGTASTADAKFLIKRITVAGTITKTEYANGNRNFDKIWDNRATGAYVYSFIL